MAGGVFHIENKVYCTLKINGTEVAASWNLFKEVVVIHGFGLPIPQMKLTVQDMHGYLTGDLAVNDGTRITITLGKNEDTSRDLDFVVYGIKHGNADNGNLLVLNCVLDCPKFTYEAGRDVTDGSSIDALASAASAGGLSHVTDLNTSDTMKWLNCGEPRHIYVQRIADHSYNGKQTCVMSVPNIYKELVTQDMFEKLKADPVVTLCYSFDDGSNEVEGNPLTVEEVSPVTLSGAMNSWTNYGHVHDQHSLSGKDLDFEKASPVVMGDGLPVNKDLKGEVEGSQISWGGFFDVGCDGDVKSFNLHKHYYEADYLNTRHRALFTEGLRVSIEAFTDLQLFDTVKYIQTDNLSDSDMVNQRYIGKYILGGQTMMIRGHHYIEVLDLYRSFIEESGETNVVGGAGGGGGGSSSGSGGSDVGSIGNQVPINTDGGGESMLDFGDSGSSLGGSGSSIGGKEIKLDDVGNTANEFKPPVSTVLDKENAIKDQAAKTPNDAVNEVGDKFDKIVQETEDRFKEAGSDYKTPEFLKKYGEDADFLDAAMREFSRAKDLMSMCDMLGDCELASLEMAKLKTPDMLNELESRAEWLDSKINGMNSSINNLISKGDVSASYLDPPKTKIECMDFAANSIKDAIDGVLPDTCTNRIAFDRLMIPKTGLEQLLNKIENFIRDLLCSAGESADDILQGKENITGVDKVSTLADAVKSTGLNAKTGVNGLVDDVKNFEG